MFFKKKSQENQKRRLPKWVPVWLDTPLRMLLKLTIAGAILLFCISCYFWHQSGKFDIEKVGEMPARTIILDKDGNTFATLGGQRRKLIRYEEIPEHLKAALFAREDSDFKSHSGVKWSGLARAALRNIKDGQFTQGGSTLSMQLIKNTYDQRQKSIYRKMLEIALTYRLERRYSKNEILTHYLNRIYFGAGCYGIEEACQTYFGKSIADLNEGESAMLVGIIRGPELFSPFRNLDGALQQRDQVIERMLTIGAIDSDHAEKIKLQPIQIRRSAKLPTANDSYVLQMVRRHLNEIVSPQQIQDGGLVVHTSIDANKVKQLESLNRRLGPNKSIQTAGVVIDAATGAVLAINGGNDAITAPFNIALDGRRTLRDAYLPLLFLAAVNLGEKPIVNEPVQTGRLLDRDQLNRFNQKLKLGENFDKGEDLFRGNIATSPLRLANAYCVYATKGELPHTFIIDSVESSNGEELYRHPDKKTRITLKDNVEIARNLFSHQPNQVWQYDAIDPKLRDAWVIQIDGQVVTLLWCGMIDNSAVPLSRQTIEKAFAEVLKN